MKRKVALSPKNTTGAPETAASGLTKKPRHSHTPSSGPADQEPPPEDVAPREEPEKHDVDTTPGDARPTALVEEEENPVDTEDEAEEVMEPDDDEKQAAAGWLSKPKTVDATVAEAVATLAKINAPKKKQNADALEALPALEAKVGNGITKTDCTLFCETWSLGGQAGAKDKIPGKLRKLLEKKEKDMERQGELDGEKVVLQTTLQLEEEAQEALPEGTDKLIVWRSLLLRAELMAKASSGCVSFRGDLTPFVDAVNSAGVEVMRSTEEIRNTTEGLLLRVISSLEAKIAELPPDKVAQAVIDRLKLLKHAPRTNGAACAALATTIRDAATGFAARGPKSAAKMSVALPGFPIIDDETHAQRTAQYVEWTAAPAAGRADVWSGVPRDSYALRTAPPLQKWPKWLDRPTIVGGIELTTIKSWDVLAKKLVHAEKSCAKKRKREQEGCDSEEEEEESGEEESG
jgi:hypothetical protein